MAWVSVKGENHGLNSRPGDVWINEERDTDLSSVRSSDLLCCPSAIAARLREQWRAIRSGGCKIISMGDKCQCHLCLIDRLQAFANDKAT